MWPFCSASHRLNERFLAALQYACRLHDGQRRKGSAVPYFSHLLAVAALVLESGGAEDVAIAALLHDALEDHPRLGKTEKEIAAAFGSVVLNIVRAVSDAQSKPKGPWRNRKERFIGTIPNLEQSALHVLLADKLNNVQCILRDFRQYDDRVWLRFHGQRDGTLWYYESVTAALRLRGFNPHGLLDDLTQAVFHLRELSTISDRS